MLQEHKAIVVALDNLKTAAKEENKPEHAHFAVKLTLHAQNEEEVLYPAAILVGEYLKLKLEK
jgi:hemerythrin superfamily protein